MPLPNPLFLMEAQARHGDAALQACAASAVLLMAFALVVTLAVQLAFARRRCQCALAEAERLRGTQAAQMATQMATQMAAQLAAQLAAQMAAREAVLQAQHAQLLAIAREQALQLERQRLMRDMHDGIGSALISSLVLVEQDSLPCHEVAAMLRECVDDLRLVIDSLEPIGHDLLALLATLRHRLGKRLTHAGLRLDWQVQDLPALPWLDATQALQVLRILQEAFANILKHARASEVRVHARVLRTPGVPDQVCVGIEDNGCGFDPCQAPSGRGLRHLHQRAQRLHATLDIDSEPGMGTRISLILPVQITPVPMCE